MDTAADAPVDVTSPLAGERGAQRRMGVGAAGRASTASPEVTELAPAPARGTLDILHQVAWSTGLPRVGAIAHRELAALFVSPVGWVVGAVFVFLVSGFGFIATVLGGQQASMNGVFGVIANFLLLMLIPLLTMRAFAEERSQGTLELLLTAPVRDWELAVGKWLGAFTFYVLLIATTLAYVLLLAIYVPDKVTVSLAGMAIRVGNLDFGLMAATYIGLLLVGAAAIAVGVFASSLTRNQMLAFFLALGILLLIWYAGYVLGFISQPPANLVLDYIGGYNRYQSFALGQVTLRDAVYFITLGASALLMTTRLLESRRWR